MPKGAARFAFRPRVARRGHAEAISFPAASRGSGSSYRSLQNVIASSSVPGPRKRLAPQAGGPAAWTGARRGRAAQDCRATRHLQARDPQPRSEPDGDVLACSRQHIRAAVRNEACVPTMRIDADFCHADDALVSVACARVIDVPERRHPCRTEPAAEHHGSPSTIWWRSHGAPPPCFQRASAGSSTADPTGIDSRPILLQHRRRDISASPVSHHHN